jgi:nucleotide-binding universal stress UspA family protein
MVSDDGKGAYFAEPVSAACDIARCSGAVLRLVHVHMPATPDPIYVEGLPVINERMRSLGQDHVRAYLERVRDRISAEQGLRVIIAIRDPANEGARDATIADELAADAAATDTDLIVMTTHGRGGLARFWLGSVADKVLQAAPAPLLLVRPPADTIAGVPDG